MAVIKYTGNPDNRFLKTDQYRQLLETGLKLLAGADDFGALLKSLFPGGRVGMKTNCLSSLNPTMLPLADALSDMLQETAGIGDNDIIIWERTNRELKRAGFTLNASSFGRRCLGTDASGAGYGDDFYSSGRVNSLVSNVLTRMVNHSINLPVLKDHSIAGLSAGMKNMYGAIHNPNKYHANHCSPYAADINNLAPIRKKHRLTIIDAVRIQYDRGPGFNRDSIDFYNGLLISEDPVAVDRVALEIIDHLRVKNGRKKLADSGRGVKYIEAAGAIGLGTAVFEDIDLQVANVDAAGRESAGELLP